MAVRPVVGVLALQGDVREHLAALDAVGAEGRTVRRASELESVDGIILPGGESSAIDKLLRAFDLFEPLRQRLLAGLPAYGSCAGMILLADHVVDGIAGQQTLGGIPMTVRRNAFGRQVQSFETDVVVAEVDPGGPMHAVFIRAPWVESVGHGVEVLARVPEHGTPSAASGRVVAVRHGALLATAFHPEMTGDLRVHRLLLSLVRGDAAAGTDSAVGPAPGR